MPWIAKICDYHLKRVCSLSWVFGEHFVPNKQNRGAVNALGLVRRVWYLLAARTRRRQWHPTPVLFPGKSHGRRSLVGCSPRSRWWSDTTERLHFHFSLFTFMHWRRKWQPTPVFLPGESQGQWSLVGCHLWGRTESDTTEVTQQQQQQLWEPGRNISSISALVSFLFYKMEIIKVLISKGCNKECTKTYLHICMYL